MGSSQAPSLKNRFYQIKIKSLGVASLKELGQLMGQLQRQAFRKANGKIWELTMAEVSIEAIASLAQFYDQPLRCFTFGDFQLTPMVEEFEEILGCPLGGRKPQNLDTGIGPRKASRKWGGWSTKEMFGSRGENLGKSRRMGPVHGCPGTLIFRVVLFPNVDGLVDRAAIDAFLAFYDCKESLVVAVLADLYDTFDRRCEKNNARIVCYTSTLYVWLVSHLFRQEFPRWKKGRTGILISCGEFPNVPLMGMRDCINYNPALAIRQLGYPMRGAPLEEGLTPFIAQGFNSTNTGVLQKVRKAWERVQKKDEELRGSSNGPISGYRRWLKAYTQGLDWLPNLRTTKEVEGEAPEEDEEFRGALWGSNNELKLQREERDESQLDGIILKDELKTCLRSNRSLSQRLCETEINMLAIISKYKEELNLAIAHEHKVADEYARVYTKKEARGRVIDSLHQEATMWMDQFALTLNGSQELPQLLAKAKEMVDAYSAPEEIHGLLSYCQHMIDLMAHIIRSR
ncbi:hypothetical protein GmHk_08G023386 [Glycine max]|nr:hypothetical protein GmHk_08G023386 [Glycine max]